jgi:reactive intermediate/imine deaminase
MTDLNLTFGPYTPVRKAGNFYFISGQVGVDPLTKTASADVAQQTKQVLYNLESLLAEQNLTMNDVIKTAIFVTNIDDFASVNAVYETFFDNPRPARSTVQVAALPKVAGETPLVVEIEAVAYKEAEAA